MHLPVFPLVARAVRGLGRLEGVSVDRFQGEVPGDILQLAGFDVLLLDLGQRLTDVPGAEGSLVIGEVDERDRRVALAFEGRILDTQHHVPGFGRSGGRSGPEERLDLL